MEFRLAVMQDLEQLKDIERNHQNMNENGIQILKKGTKLLSKLI